VVESAKIRTIEVGNPRGNVDIGPSPDGRIHVTALKICRGRDEAEAKRLAAQLSVTTVVQGDRYVIKVTYPKRVDIKVNFWDLFSGYSVLGGVTFVLMSVLHGATFLAIKTTDDIRVRAVRVARVVAPISAAAVAAFVIWTHVLSHQGFLLTFLDLVAILAALAAVWLVRADRDGWAFTATALTIGAVVFNIFADLYPRVLVSTLGAANDLTIDNTSSAPYALKVMTIVTVVLLPGVFVYQAWTYHVFRQRVTRGAVSRAEASHG
jgi:cytochrome d ubiquinol oxidase subunit II